MKRLMMSAVLGAAALVFTASANAGGCYSCNKSCGAEFCVRQYNAFSPVCHGSLYLDGIMPFGCGWNPQMTPTPYFAPGYGCGNCAVAPAMPYQNMPQMLPPPNAQPMPNAAAYNGYAPQMYQQPYPQQIVPTAAAPYGYGYPQQGYPQQPYPQQPYPQQGYPQQPNPSLGSPQQ